MSVRHDIVPAHLAIQSMRDNGYKNAAYALAELLDNAIQAGSSKLEVICSEDEIFLEDKRSNCIKNVYVLDNGSGMDAKTLRLSLQFGNGTHLDPENQKGIGKFGMGLPSSSISQCTRVEVYTWQKGHENSIYSYLDLDEVRNQTLMEIPEPVKKPFPEEILSQAEEIGKSGTLVIWSNLDRLMWKRSTTLFRNSEHLIGRLYRTFIDRDHLSIRLLAFNARNPDLIIHDEYLKPNDPMYLMSNTSCPEPFTDKPMFEKYGGKAYAYDIKVKFKKKNYPVTLRFTKSKKDARSMSSSPGGLPHGKHAAKNAGVSIMRAGREIDLDTSWTSPSDPRDRWWGVEIDFPTELDEVFGLSNNKQSVRNFSILASFEDYEEEDGRSKAEIMEELELFEDNRKDLFDIAHNIRKNISQIRRDLRAETEKIKSVAEETKNHPAENPNSPEGIAARADEEIEAERGPTKNDTLRKTLPEKERTKIIRQSLLDGGEDKEFVKHVTANLRYIFQYKKMETTSFFSVEPIAGSIIITLNTNHPAYTKLWEITNQDDLESLEKEDLVERLRNAKDSLKLILQAWARFEDYLPDGKEKDKAQEFRMDWGRMAKRFFQEME
ncbi:MAG: ATP-binding protein [Leptospira sp.]|nr:ATP-binding protein [Leptospira sp.]